MAIEALERQSRGPENGEREIRKEAKWESIYQLRKKVESESSVTLEGSEGSSWRNSDTIPTKPNNFFIPSFSFFLLATFFFFFFLSSFNLFYSAQKQQAFTGKKKKESVIFSSWCFLNIFFVRPLCGFFKYKISSGKQ